jgi:glycerate kinase
VRVLIAPDKFKDALDAPAVAAALAAGVRDQEPHAEIDICPLGDGGEGTGRIWAEAWGADARRAEVVDPLGRPRSATWWWCAAKRTAIVEMAEASGLALLKPEERHALRTTSYGCGQLIAAAVAAGCSRILLCVGGSATVDGGAGCLQALGWQLLADAGKLIETATTGADLGRVRGLRAPAVRPELRIEILCDVDNPLLGSRGAAVVFAPQKGASDEAVGELEGGMANWNDILERDCGTNMRGLPGAGAAGGLPAGLAAALGARLVPGFAVVANLVGLAGRMTRCEVCLTGEGRIDGQTAGGKVVAGVARLACAASVPAIAFTGAVRCESGQTVGELAATLGLRRIVCITPPQTPLAQALAETAANLRAAAACLIAGERDDT